jgi:hypothetical protein
MPASISTNPSAQDSEVSTPELWFGEQFHLTRFHACTQELAAAAAFGADKTRRQVEVQWRASDFSHTRT